ncbi:MAG: hypothetical protein A2Z96_08160 [Spirochaetes bacterium GWB1_48_6]|nr:MAG: hypothetical protein A2Z96_08160 [Spirochaetes bacterium GWB1_48_6]
MKRIDPCIEFATELPKIQKPARYLGGENASLVKDVADIRLALCFPDLYEIGMANNAMRILYSGLNRLEGVACERVFSVALDYETLLRKTGIPLYGLETGTPISSFDVLAFTIGYELLATNILTVMDLSGIPLLAADRTNEHPIVIAGGPAITNPAPYTKIFDAVWIGEAENRFFELIAKMRTAKLSGISRSGLIAMLANEPSVWVPGRHDKKAIKNVYNEFNSAPYHYRFPIPIVKPIQDHGVVEIMRGCPNGCRFCHAGYFYRPRRLRSVDRILEDVETQIKVAGHREISLSSLSSGDYPGIASLVSLLNARWAHEGVSFQLPSLKVESFPLELIEDISGTRKSGLTFAVETPLEQWQMTLNKTVGLEKIRSILLEAEKRGYRVAKFYFMVGLPLPIAAVKEEDAIVSLIQDISKAAPTIKLNINIATFVPKPHTPFQWSAQLNPIEAASRIFTIKDSFRSNARVKISYHAPYLSWLEGIVSRGDERVGDLIISAFKHGARFDAWDDLFRKNAWENAIADTGIELASYSTERETASVFPWAGVSLRVSKKYLLDELERSKQSVLTAICTEPCTTSCGSCSDFLTVSGDSDIEKRIEELHQSDVATRSNDIELRLSARQAPAEGTRYRLMFRYKKIGRAAFFAHHEVQSLINTSLERAGLSVAYSQGFNPMPRLEISEPLSLGFESLDEYGVAILTAQPQLDASTILVAANRLLHGEMQFQDTRILECVDGKRFPSLSSVHWGSCFLLDLLDTGLDAELFLRYFNDLIETKPQLTGGSSKANLQCLEIILPFAGSRELGLPSLFEAAFGVSIRESKVSVRRLAQYAKYGDGERLTYFDRYSRL